jgi:hypothetical protein
VRAQVPARDRQPAPAGVGAIRGRILSAESGDPIRKARVDILGSTGERPDPVYTDPEGRFSFSAVPAGRYTLTAWKSGYAETRVGAAAPWDPATVLAVEPGRTLEPVELRLPKGASISGRVLDDAGDPLPDMRVMVGRAAPVNGRLQFQSLGLTATTDDRGEYRIGGLSSGSFVVNAFGWAAPSAPLTGSVLAARPFSIFYPHTAFLGQARPVTLRPGEDLTAIDIVYTSETMVMPMVSGRVIDPRGLGSRAAISAASAAYGIGAATRSLGGAVQPTGEFQFPLSPGDYVLTAQAGDMMATMPLTVDRADISGLELVLVKSARLIGRLIYDGTSPRPANAAVLAAQPTGDPMGMREPAAVRSNGAFVLSNVIGVCELHVLSAPGWQVKAIRAAGRDLLDIPIEFKGGEELRDVEIILTDKTAELSGVITEAPATTSVSVLVFPDDARQIARRAKWVRPDQDGRFVVAGLMPGTYLAAVASAVDDLQWQTPANLNRLRPTAQRVTLGDGERKSITLAWTESR